MSVIELNDFEKARNMLRDATGIVVFSLHNCPPCDVATDILTNHKVRGQTVFIVKLDSRKREDCALLRGFKVRAFPTITLFESGIEIQRVEGINPMDDPEDILRYVECGLFSAEFSD